jgi:hypothetical protein
MSDEDDAGGGDDPLYIEVKGFLRKIRRADPEVVSIVMDLIGFVWGPTKTAFAFDEEALAARFAAKLPARGYTP